MRKTTFELILSRPIPRSTNIYKLVHQNLKKMSLKEMFTVNTILRLSAISACIGNGKFEEAGIYRITYWFNKKTLKLTYSIRRLG